jgi:Family of unknown function (DUF6011)
MSYMNAPATNMLATNCACCSLPLVDAVSVETGVGPECRRKHGFAKPDTEVGYTAACTLVSEVPEAAEILAGTTTVRELVNRLVYRIARDQSGPHVITWTNAVRALGYAKLAARIAKRLAEVEIDTDGAVYVVRARRFSDEHLAAMRSVPGRRRDRESGCDRVPLSSRRALFDALTKAHPGRVARGPKGLFMFAA